MGGSFCCHRSFITTVVGGTGIISAVLKDSLCQGWCQTIAEWFVVGAPAPALAILLWFLSFWCLVHASWYQWCQLRWHAIRDEKGVNMNIFPTKTFNRELLHTLHNVIMTLILNAQVELFNINVIYTNLMGSPPALRCNQMSKWHWYW